MMTRRVRSRLVPIFVATATLAVLPACQGAGWFRRGDREVYRPAPAVVPYSAYRPAYSPGPPRRTLFLGSYAGYNYRQAPPAGYVPTRYGVEAWGYPVQGHDHDHGHRNGR
jgi:hypothetical protein